MVKLNYPFFGGAGLVSSFSSFYSSIDLSSLSSVGPEQPHGDDDLFGATCNFRLSLANISFCFVLSF